VLRWLSSKLAAPNSLRSRLTFPDPERLGTLSDQLARQTTDDGGALKREFSAFVSSIRIGPFWKLTYPDRLGETNRVLCARLRELAPDKVDLLDLGGSDGITTQDLVEHLRAALNVKVNACMVDLYCYLLRFARAGVVEYRMTDGSPVMVRVGPLAIQLSSVSRTRNPISRTLGKFYLGRKNFRESMPQTASFSLVNPRVTADAGIEVLEWSALARKPELVNRLNVCRASNILNRDYFSADQMRCAAGHLHAYLVEGGLLIVSRNRLTTHEVEEGAIWRKEGDRFQLLEEFGGGSEAGEVINAFRASATPTPV